MAGEGAQELHRRAVVAVIASAGPTTRQVVARATGLSRATVSRLVTDLLDDGLLREEIVRRSVTRGRPAGVLTVAPPPGAALAIDWRRDGIHVLLADASGQVIDERQGACEVRLGTPEGAEAVAEQVRVLVRANRVARKSLAGVAVSLACPVDLDGRLLHQASDFDLGAALGVREWSDRVIFGNDVQFGAAGEAAFGAATGLSNVLYVHVSTGLGAGLVLGRRLYRGLGFAGDIGHVPVNAEGDVCHCGNRGCLETLVSARSLLRALSAAHPDRPLGVGDLIELCHSGDLGAVRLAADAGRTLGRALAHTVTVLNPDAIVVGGDLAHLGAPLLGGIEESVRRHTSPLTVAHLALSPGRLGRRATALGGVALALGVINNLDGAVSPAGSAPRVSTERGA